MVGPGTWAAVVVAAAAALGDGGGTTGVQQASAPVARAPSRWHGSTLLFDQSVTTQTIGVGGDYQTYNPTYEQWLAFRPQLFLHESEAQSLSVHLWANLFLELTDSDTTTRLRELLIGPTYLWATYGRTLRERNGYRTTVTLGPRFTLPTDKASRGSGHLIGLGASAGLAQTLPLRGKQARALSGARLALGVVFNRPVTRSKSPVNDEIRQLRQDFGGDRLISDQLSGTLLVKSMLNVSASGELRVTPRLALTLSYVVLNAWVNEPPAGECVMIYTGCDAPMTIADPTAYRVSTWATAAVGYDVTDDLTVSLGYYNLASQSGPDGQRRNPLWSPAARFFLTLTGNLDAFYGRLVGKTREAKAAAPP